LVFPRPGADYIAPGKKESLPRFVRRKTLSRDLCGKQDHQLRRHPDINICLCLPCAVLSPSSPSLAVALDDNDARMPSPFRVADPKFGEILLTHDPEVSLEKLPR
jgi:hypothetical protein